MAKGFGIVRRGQPLPIKKKGSGLVLQGNYTVWDDLSIALTTTAQGALNKPEYDYTNMGLLFPTNDATEIAYCMVQMQHNKMLGTAIRPHIHYVQSGAAQPTFKMDYKFYNNNSAVPAGFTTLSTADGDKGIFTYDSGNLLQIAAFPEIAAPTSETVSAHFEFKLYREDTETGDFLAKYIDIHYLIDSFGSAGEYDKWTE